MIFDSGNKESVSRWSSSINLYLISLAAAGIKDDDEETIQRGLDTYPEDKDRQNIGAGATGGSSSGTVEKGNEVLIMNAKNEDRTTSFFSQPGILAGKDLSPRLTITVG